MWDDLKLNRKRMPTPLQVPREPGDKMWRMLLKTTGVLHSSPETSSQEQKKQDTEWRDYAGWDLGTRTMPAAEAGMLNGKLAQPSSTQRCSSPTFPTSSCSSSNRPKRGDRSQAHHSRLCRWQRAGTGIQASCWCMAQVAGDPRLPFPWLSTSQSLGCWALHLPVC